MSGESHTIEDFPCWAVPILEHLDEGSTEDERSWVRDWLASWPPGCKGFSYGGDVHFSWNPEFGPACECETLIMVMI